MPAYVLGFIPLSKRFMILGQFIKGLGKKIKKMVLENSIGQMVLSMRVNGKIIKQMDRED